MSKIPLYIGSGGSGNRSFCLNCLLIVYLCNYDGSGGQKLRSVIIPTVRLSRMEKNYYFRANYKHKINKTNDIQTNKTNDIQTKKAGNI